MHTRIVSCQTCFVIKNHTTPHTIGITHTLLALLTFFSLHCPHHHLLHRVWVPELRVSVHPETSGRQRRDNCEPARSSGLNMYQDCYVDQLAVEKPTCVRTVNVRLQRFVANCNNNPTTKISACMHFGTCREIEWKNRNFCRVLVASFTQTTASHKLTTCRQDYQWPSAGQTDGGQVTI